MKYFGILIIFASVFLYSTFGHAQKDSFSLAVSIIEDFGAEEDDLLTNLEQSMKGTDKDYIKDRISSSKKEKADAVAGLKNTRWLESEPNRFSKKVFSIVNTYTNKQIEALKELSGRIKTENKKEITRIIERAVFVRDSSLKKLADMQKEEKVLRDRIRMKEKPVSGVDAPPIEEPFKERGILER
ncbi:MAG: hypothetical protein HZC45_07955 [Deltaproteobacteria bacterium]|nr:hypothetical protein [Deltaproteobacteria bacterium]